MPSSSRLTTHVFERLPSWILGGLIVVWSLAGMMGLRNALMAGFIALGVAQFARNQDRRSALKPGWLWIVAGILFLQVTISLIFSIDRGYSSHRWWADYTAPLLLAFSAAQFARTLNYRFLFFCFGAGLLLNGSYDLFQVFTHPGTESWKGFFSDYGWQNGYLLLTLPMGLLLLRADTNDAFPRWFPVFFSLSFFLALTASLSSWARANQLCFLAVMVPSIAILICQHGTETGFKKRLLWMLGVLWVGALCWRFTPAAYFLAGVTTYEFILTALTLPIVLYGIPRSWRNRLIPFIFPAAVVMALIGLGLIYKFANLEGSHSELVRKYSHIEFLSRDQPAPVLGFGPGRDIVFQGIPEWPVRQDEYLRNHGISHPSGEGRGHTHIQWINWRYELGFPGLGLILILLGGAVWLFARGMTRGQMAPIPMALGASVAAFSLNIFMGQLFTAGLSQQFWLMWGLFVANCAGKSKSAN